MLFELFLTALFSAAPVYIRHADTGTLLVIQWKQTCWKLGHVKFCRNFFWCLQVRN